MTFCVFDVITLNYISCLLIDLHLDEQIHFCNVVVGQLQLKKQQKENANVNEIEIEIYVWKNYCVVLCLYDIHLLCLAYNHEIHKLRLDIYEMWMFSFPNIHILVSNYVFTTSISLFHVHTINLIISLFTLANFTPDNRISKALSLQLYINFLFAIPYTLGVKVCVWHVCIYTGLNIRCFKRIRIRT